jgi:hypothetical protein
MGTYLPVVPNDGLIGFTDVIVQAIANGNNNSRIHLYANDYWPYPGTLLGDFVELVGAGYLPAVPGDPSNLGVDVTRRDVWLFPETVFTANPSGLPVLAYGYWLDFFDPLTAVTRVLWAQRFQAPQALLVAGQQIRFTLSFGGAQC